MILGLLIQQIAWSQNGKESDLLDALRQCDKNYEFINAQNKELNNKLIKIEKDIYVCNISDSTKSVAIQAFKKKDDDSQTLIKGYQKEIANKNLQLNKPKIKPTPLVLIGIIVGFLISKL